MNQLVHIWSTDILKPLSPLNLPLPAVARAFACFIKEDGDQNAAMAKGNHMETPEQAPELTDKKTILVVDDDASILETVSSVLGRDYSVLRAGSGKEALE